MISVRDLQIGDFINTENNGVVQITVLSWRAVGYEGGASTPEHCSYIPLTEDILLKNGFVGVELTDSYELNTDYYEIEVWKYSDGLWVVNVQWIEFSSTPESKATVSYVHHLQHLFTLCGIEKEITI